MSALRNLAVGAIGTLVLALPLTANAAAPSASANPPLLTGFLSAPTDQIGVPGDVDGGEITPEGDLYTGWAEYELSFGRKLHSWNQPTRTLPNPLLPLLSSTLNDGDVVYTLTAFAVDIAGQPVAYYTMRISNMSASTQSAQVAMGVAFTHGAQIKGIYGGLTSVYRYERGENGIVNSFSEPLGLSLSPTFPYAVSGRDLTQSGVLLYRGPAAAGIAVATPASSSTSAIQNEQLYKTTLRSHTSTSYTWQVPLSGSETSSALDSELDGVSAAGALAQLQSNWNAQEAGMMTISVPERKVVATYEAAITEMLTSRYQTAAGLWVQGVNKLQYQSFWIRDAAAITQALDLAGLHTQAAQNLAYLDNYQQPSGLFISRIDQYDGWGQALWALSQHAQLTQSPAYAAAQLPAISSAIAWLENETTTDPMGLMPAGNPADDELITGHITGDNLWTAVGLRSAVADAVLAGRPDLAAAWQAADDRFEASLDQALNADVAANGHITPALDAVGGQNWGNYYASYPMQILPATSPAISATLAYANTQMVQGLPTYDSGNSLHDYLGFAIFQSELEAGDASAAVNGLYAELAHTTSTDGGWEDGVTLTARAPVTDLAPHGTFAADYVALLRNMMVADTPTGGVNLLSGASPAWLQNNDHIAVANAPTDNGTISFTERSSATGETLLWHDDLPADRPLTWTLPAWALNAHVVGAGTLTGSLVSLSGDSGKVAVTFSGIAPAQSYADAVATLNASYRARGQSAPLVAATH